MFLHGICHVKIFERLLEWFSKIHGSLTDQLKTTSLHLSTIRDADLIMVMDQGTHNELLEENGFYVDLYIPINQQCNDPRRDIKIPQPRNYFWDGVFLCSCERSI